MNLHSKRNLRRRRRDDRRGVAAVEFAFVAPLFVVMVVGLVQLSSLLDTYNQFAMAAREGGRAALFEREGMLLEGQSTNEKVIKDVEAFLEASGFDLDLIEVVICFPGEPAQTFDLDAPDNELQLFEVRVQQSLNDALVTPPPGSESQKIYAGVVFRNGSGNYVP